MARTMRGVRQFVRLNWAFYAVAVGAVAIMLSAAARLEMPAAGRVLLYGLALIAAIWVVTSLAASWIVYDRSALTRWDWLPRALGFTPGAWINIHAGLDESTPAVRALFGGAQGMAAEALDFRNLPIEKGSVEAALLLLSARALRSDEARIALFTELRRVLGPGGRVVVAEHLRDAANFLAFGPGFLHFHSRRTWTRCFSRTRFDIHREFAITPFVRVFVLRRLT